MTPEETAETIVACWENSDKKYAHLQMLIVRGIKHHRQSARAVADLENETLENRIKDLEQKKEIMPDEPNGYTDSYVAKLRSKIERMENVVSELKSNRAMFEIWINQIKDKGVTLEQLSFEMKASLFSAAKALNHDCFLDKLNK